MNNIIIKYNASVLVDAGWRSVIIEAEAEKISEKMVVVIDVLDIDGESPKRNQSRTGAKRQTYNGENIAKREIGKKKRLSSCEIICT